MNWKSLILWISQIIIKYLIKRFAKQNDINLNKSDLSLLIEIYDVVEEWAVKHFNPSTNDKESAKIERRKAKRIRFDNLASAGLGRKLTSKQLKFIRDATCRSNNLVRERRSGKAKKYNYLDN